RILEAGAAQFPLMFLLFIPIAIGMNHLFPWIPDSPRWVQANSDAHTIMQHKAMLLNKTFFLIRVPIYFFIWWAFSATLRRWSIERDRNPQGRDWQRILENVSGIGIVVYALTMTFAVVDWIMSLDATWFSTIYGLIYLAGNWINLGRFLILFEFAVPFALLLSRRLKKQPAFMVPLCAFIIFVRMVDLYWMVEPNFISAERQIVFNWMYLVAPLAIGGFW